jgi:hypothetical protein
MVICTPVTVTKPTLIDIPVFNNGVKASQAISAGMCPTWTSKAEQSSTYKLVSWPSQGQ